VDQPTAVAVTAIAEAWPRAIETEIGTTLCAIGSGKGLWLWDFDFGWNLQTPQLEKVMNETFKPSCLSYLNNTYNWYKFADILRLRMSWSGCFDMEWLWCKSFLFKWNICSSIFNVLMMPCHNNVFMQVQHVTLLHLSVIQSIITLVDVDYKSCQSALSPIYQYDWF